MKKGVRDTVIRLLTLRTQEFQTKVHNHGRTKEISSAFHPHKAKCNTKSSRCMLPKVLFNSRLCLKGLRIHQCKSHSKFFCSSRWCNSNSCNNSSRCTTCKWWCSSIKRCKRFLSSMWTQCLSKLRRVQEISCLSSSLYLSLALKRHGQIANNCRKNKT